MGKLKAINSKVRGISYHERWRYAKKVYPGEVIFLHREKRNPANPNAVPLFVKRGLFRSPKQIGYLSDELADEFAPLIDQNGIFRVKALEVSGSGKRIGLNIRIGFDPAQKAKATARLKKYGQKGSIKRSKQDPL